MSSPAGSVIANDLDCRLHLAINEDFAIALLRCTGAPPS